jgi:hypothetical protein
MRTMWNRRFPRLSAYLLGTVLIAIVAANPWSSSHSPTVQACQKVVLGRTTVRDGKYFYASFRVDPRKMKDPRLMGSFHTFSGNGPGNDIQAVITREDQFQNWISGLPSRTLYSTNTVSNGRFDLPVIQAGTYCLAFRNTFSSPLDNYVFADVELRFQTQ